MSPVRLTTLLSGHAKHPAYLKVNGKPVVFFWRQQRFSVDDWVTIRHQVDPNHASIWIAEGTDLSYLRVFDGIHWYSVAWSADPASSWRTMRRSAENCPGPGRIPLLGLARDAGNSAYNRTFRVQIRFKQPIGHQPLRSLQIRPSQIYVQQSAQYRLSFCLILSGFPQQPKHFAACSNLPPLM